VHGVLWNVFNLLVQVTNLEEYAAPLRRAAGSLIKARWVMNDPSLLSGSLWVVLLFMDNNDT